MKKHLRALSRVGVTALVVAGLVAAGTSPAGAADQFGSGNVVVYRVGTGAAASGSAARAVFLDEYTPTGTLVRSIAMPTATVGADKRLVAKGDDKSEGMLTRSADGQFLAVPGYDAAVGSTVGSGSTSAAVPRVVGLVDCAAEVDTSTALTDVLSGNEIRGAYTSNGTNIWAMGDNDSASTAGTYFTTIGATTATNLIPAASRGSQRHLEAFGGQLYTTGSGSGTGIRFASVGSGLPTTPIPAPPYGDFGFTSGSFYAFFFADLSPAVAGVDTFYVAEDGSGGGIRKYSLVGSTWTLRGTIAVASSSGNIRGLTGTVLGTQVTLFATTTQTNGGLFLASDATGYNVNASGTATKIADAGANKQYRGVAMAPASCPPPAVVSEAPLGILLPLTAVGIGAVGVLGVRRRRAARAAR